MKDPFPMEPASKEVSKKSAKLGWKVSPGILQCPRLTGISRPGPAAPAPRRAGSPGSPCHARCPTGSGHPAFVPGQKLGCHGPGSRPVRCPAGGAAVPGRSGRRSGSTEAGVGTTSAACQFLYMLIQHEAGGWGRNKPCGGSKRHPPGTPGRVNRRGSVGLGGESGGRAGEGAG